MGYMFSRDSIRGDLFRAFSGGEHSEIRVYNRSLADTNISSEDEPSRDADLGVLLGFSFFLHDQMWRDW